MGAETSLGRWITERGNREDIVILTKCGHPCMFGKKRLNEKDIRKDFSSPNFGLAEQVDDPWGGGGVTISGSAYEDAREWYRGNQIPVIAYSSLGRGLFSGRVKSSKIQNAGENTDALAVISTSKAERMQENIDALQT